jgi:hypothetical protein
VVFLRATDKPDEASKEFCACVAMPVVVEMASSRSVAFMFELGASCLSARAVVIRRIPKYARTTATTAPIPTPRPSPNPGFGSLLLVVVVDLSVRGAAAAAGAVALDSGSGPMDGAEASVVSEVG